MVVMITTHGQAEAVVDRIEIRNYLEMIDGKILQKNHEIQSAGMIPQIIKETKVVEDGMIDETMRMIGRYLCRRMNAWNRNCLVQEIQESISANTKIFLLKQPGIKSLVTLHL